MLNRLTKKNKGILKRQVHERVAMDVCCTYCGQMCELDPALMWDVYYPSRNMA